MISIWIVYSIAAAAVCVSFLAAGRRPRASAAAPGWLGVPVDPLGDKTEIDIDAPEARVDAGAALRLVLKRLAPVLASHSVRMEIACSPKLLVRLQSAVLADLLEELVTGAIQCAPASRLLIMASAQDGLIEIGVTDDLPETATVFRQQSLRGLKERIAVRGFDLDISVLPHEGTTMRLRLAAVPEAAAAMRDRCQPGRAPPLSGSSATSCVRAEL